MPDYLCNALLGVCQPPERCTYASTYYDRLPAQGMTYSESAERLGRHLLHILIEPCKVAHTLRPAGEHAENLPAKARTKKKHQTTDVVKSLCNRRFGAGGEMRQYATPPTVVTSTGG